MCAGPIGYYSISDDDSVTIQLSESALLFRVDKRIMLSRLSTMMMIIK